MRLGLARLLPLFSVLLILSFCTIGIFAKDKQGRNVGNSINGKPAQEPLTDQTHKDGGWNIEHTVEGAAAVDEATNLLHKIKPAGRPSRFSKPSGVFGLTAHYAKELFVLLFMNKPPEHDLITTKPPPRKLSPPLSKAVKLLEEAAGKKNPDAIFMLAEMNFHGNFTHPRNYAEAFKRYYELATLNGNSSAQHMVGFFYATGLGGAVKPDQARAMLYHTFAAEQGEIRSEMTVAYRHHSGISTRRNCEEAVFHYRKISQKAIAYIRSGPPGGHSIIKDAYRIADDMGGVYGEGASHSSSGQNAKQGSVQSDAHAAFDDVLEYIDWLSRKGDIKATFNLGKVHYYGSRGLKQDYTIAKARFFEVARTVWKNGKMRTDVSATTEKLASMAAGYLGRMFLRGEGGSTRPDIALTWFKRGVQNGDSLSQYSLGLMYLNGWEVPQDPVKASEYFGAAADQDFPAAQVRLGALFLDQGDIATAIRYFELAARNGHIEAYYYLADLSRQGVGREQSCGMAAVYYKIVAEKAEAILSSFAEANEAYDAGDLETALVDYMMAAEQGFEIGQANVAFLLDQAKPSFSFGSVLPFVNKKTSLIGDAALALVYWVRSATQSNIDSHVKVGDYYLEGLGTKRDPEKAAAWYQAAAETLQSAQAMWNLGWMYENGIGMEQDFHLAKRFYDLALETNPREAYLPVTLALYKLRLRSWWNDVTHGSVKSIQEEPELKKPFSLKEWIINFLEADAAYYDNLDADDWATHHDHMPGGDDAYYDDIDADVLETLVIVALAGVLAVLAYYRHQMTQRRARQQQEQQQQGNGRQANAAQQQQQDRGLFPRPNDPEFLNWAAGGVGH